MFTAGEDSGWTELTRGDGPAVRVSAVDLQAAKRERSRLRSGDGDVSVVLDITVQIAENFRAARRGMPVHDGAGPQAIEYVGTLDGLAGLVRDVFVAEVADGVTLLPATPEQDVRALAMATLAASGLEFAGDTAFDLGKRHCG
jgi:hypothetical protein